MTAMELVDTIERLTHERDEARRMAAAWEQSGANARLTERLVRGDLDAERRSAAAHAEWYARRIVAGIAGAMGLDTSGEGDEIHARILAEHARLVGAAAAERARCAARVRDAYPTSALKSTPALRAVAAALNAVRRGIESGDTGADGDVVLTAVARLTRERDEARADGAREMRERAAAEAMRGNGGVTHAELATIHAVAAKSLAGALDTPEARIAYLLEAHPHAGACELVAWLIRALPIVEVPA